MLWIKDLDELKFLVLLIDNVKTDNLDDGELDKLIKIEDRFKRIIRKAEKYPTPIFSFKFK